ncbi:hypothetical protein LPJ66_007953 [Kickxella alabastrina]|uniref:Uncharacterized protein n=1 Tax=Kickxella alabastrina TaxID=61397 RepID=A0ACC1I8W1_9FUNG|nr:hypothetical protein LPJ66_007953 [Kickxella alabastrina]
MSTPPSPPSSYTLHANDAKHRHTATATATERLLAQISASAYPALLLSGINLSAMSLARRRTLGVPSVMQCTMYGAVFGAAAYALASGDYTNGAGLGAGWSAIWLFFNARNAFRSRNPVPLAMTAAVVSVGSVYAWRYAWKR